MIISQEMIELLQKWEGKDLIRACHALRTQFDLTEHEASEVIEIWQEENQCFYSF